MQGHEAEMVIECNGQEYKLAKDGQGNLMIESGQTHRHASGEYWSGDVRRKPISITPAEVDDLASFIKEHF